MSDVFKVSQSKIKKWRTCRQAYHLRYVEKLKSKRVARPLTFGSAVHAIAEAKAKGIDPLIRIDEMKEQDFGRIFPEEKEMYLDILEDATLVMEDYFLYWKKAPIRYITYKGVKAEHKFDYEIESGLILTGKIDGIAKTKNGKVWMVEHKSGKNELSRDDMWKNIQAAAYYKAMEELGYPRVDGVLWDYIRSKTPTRPAFTQAGNLSKARIVTLPSLIKKMRKAGEIKDKSDYHTLLEMAMRQRESYFNRVYTPKKAKVNKVLWDDLVETAREIQEFHGKKQAMSIDRHCSWCEYEPICRARITGSDVDFVKERNFIADEEKANTKTKTSKSKKVTRRRRVRKSTNKKSK